MQDELQMTPTSHPSRLEIKVVLEVLEVDLGYAGQNQTVLKPALVNVNASSDTTECIQKINKYPLEA